VAVRVRRRVSSVPSEVARCGGARCDCGASSTGGRWLPRSSRPANAGRCGRRRNVTPVRHTRTGADRAVANLDSAAHGAGEAPLARHRHDPIRPVEHHPLHIRLREPPHDLARRDHGAGGQLTDPANDASPTKMVINGRGRKPPSPAVRERCARAAARRCDWHCATVNSASSSSARSHGSTSRSSSMASPERTIAPDAAGSHRPAVRTERAISPQRPRWSGCRATSSTVR